MDASNSKHRGGPGDALRKRRSNDRQYVFDATFGADSTQQEVYVKTTQPLIQSVLEGYNATVFAYGATGSGKTYTMVGTPEHPGCMALGMFLKKMSIITIFGNKHAKKFNIKMLLGVVFREFIALS